MESTPLATTPVFGLRYLEEEDLELNDIVGCMRPIDGGGGGDGLTFYTTLCDYTDTTPDTD